MSDEELCKRLRDLGLYSADIAADRIEALTEKLEAARSDAKEAEAYAEELEKDQVDLCRQLIDAEDKLAKAVEALRVLIQHAHNCEKELTEELHHQDFCGESLPLTNARATLAEIEGEKG
jgi:predicted  nucleic acid-binding Zn-ribbon protein